MYTYVWLRSVRLDVVVVRIAFWDFNGMYCEDIVLCWMLLRSLNLTEH